MKNKNRNTKSEIKRGPGAPAKVIKFPRGAFTIAAVVSLNPHVCELTVRNKIEAGVASKTLIRLSEDLKTKEVGRPSFRYMLKTNAPVKAKRTTKPAKKAAVLAPATVRPAVTLPAGEIIAAEPTPAPAVIVTAPEGIAVEATA